MKPTTWLKRALLAVVALVLMGTHTYAQSHSVLGEDGVLYSVQAGSYGDLFPEGHLAAADHSVLKLRIDHSEGWGEELLVPGTESDAIEARPSLLLESATGDLYLLWESWRNVLHSSILLTSLGENGWGEPIEITGAPFALKSSPRVLVTRDEVSWPDDEGNQVRRHRTVLHVAWIENGGTADEQIVYSPILLVDGDFVSSSQSVVLNDLLALGGEESHAGSYSLDQPLLNLFAGEDSRSVVAVFADHRSQHLVSLHLRVIPGELSALADRLYELIVAQPGSSTSSSEQLASLAQRSYDEVEAAGSFLQPLLCRELAERARSYIVAQDIGVAPRILAEAVRDHLLSAGTELTEPGIEKLAGDAGAHWIDFGYQPPTGKPDGANHRQARSYHVASQVAADRPTPVAMNGKELEVIVSRDGERMAVVWQDNTSELIYQESAVDGGWGKANRIRLDDKMSVETARQLVQNRLDQK